MRAFGRKAIFAAELIPMPVDDLLRWRAAGIHLRLIFEIAMIVRQIVDGNELRIECGQVHRALQHVAYIFLVRLECHWLRHSVSRKELRGVPAFDVLHGFAGKSEMLYLHAQMQFPYRLYRSEERRGGKECVSTFRSRGATQH